MPRAPHQPASLIEPKPDAGVHPEPRPSTRPRRLAIVGNPNVGKTTLFNALARKRPAKTANFPGTTQEAHTARLTTPAGEVELIDLPGIYGLSLEASESSVCRGVLEGSTSPEGTRATPPDALVIVLDATNLRRSLTLAAELLATDLPAIVIVNRLDEATRRSIHIDADRLSQTLGVHVVTTTATARTNPDSLVAQLDRATTPSGVGLPKGTTIEAREVWADAVYADIASAHGSTADHDTLTDRLDRAFTHPVVGIATFAAVMTGLFWVIFKLSSVPMDAIDLLFATLGGAIAGALPEGLLASLLVDGVVAGVGGTVIFLPQIVMLFFLIALLEQSGYLARAAFVVDRVLRPFGLPGHAFVPLLSAHACAIPAIMSARAVPDRRDRLATILAIPFMSCSARIPVYVLLTALLFPGSPAMQALAFTGCYVLGAGAGLLTALTFRRTVLKGASLPMALELPSYRLPDLFGAVRTAASRGWSFLKKAGTTILAISIVLWWLGAFPQAEPTPGAEALRAEAAVAPADEAPSILAEADAIDARSASQRSFLGRIGSTLQPAFAPLGADRQLTVGILASFAAREVFVSTMAVQVAGTDDPEAEGVFESLTTATRDDGTPLFTPATSWSMLVFFVLAMQCLPTLVVTAREAAAGRSGWAWAAVQFLWMSGVAYAAGALTFALAGGWA